MDNNLINQEFKAASASKYKLLIILMSGLIAILFLIAFSFFILLLKQGSIGINVLEHYTSLSYAYGNWAAVFINIILFSFFVLGYFTPIKKQEWRTASLYEAFIIALFTEMYGFPLTIYVLSSLFGVQLSFGHQQGHLLATQLTVLKIIDLKNAWILVMITSSLIMLVGFILIIKGWQKIYNSKGELVTDGIYQYIRHPQYLGLIIITIGMLVQWPTLITLAMWPILTLMYYRLAKKEEKEMEEKFGEKYIEYKCKVPMFLPLDRYFTKNLRGM